jgi:hypothetical protein
MKIGQVEFFVRLVKKSAPIQKGLAASMDWAVPSYFGITAATAGLLMGTLAYFVPPIGLEDEAAMDKERLVLISQILDNAAERDRKIEETQATDSGDAGGKTGQKAPGPEGEAGKENAERTGKRVAVKGPIDQPRLELSRQEALHEARTTGMIGILNSSLAADVKFNEVFGDTRNIGSDDITAQGAMWGDEIGESGGLGGLGLSGIGFGGGMGDALGIGMGDVGTVGPGMGNMGGRFGLSHGRKKPGHVTKVPQVRPQGETRVNGRRASRGIRISRDVSQCAS